MVMHLLTKELSVQLAGTAIFMLLRLGHVHAHVTPPQYAFFNTKFAALATRFFNTKT